MIIPKVAYSIAAMTLFSSVLLGQSASAAVSLVKPEIRIALVIGNAAYSHAPPVPNALNDAREVGAALGRLGFRVTHLENADHKELRGGLEKFGELASRVHTAVLFYAGHSFAVGGCSFLVPVDSRLPVDREFETSTVSLDLALRAISGASYLGLAILDGARINPFGEDGPSGPEAHPTRPTCRGLSGVETPAQILVAYSAQEGAGALDGAGRQSPFSKALLRYLEVPGLEVGLMFRLIRDAVMAATRYTQRPFVYGSLSSKGAYLHRVRRSGPR